MLFEYAGLATVNAPESGVWINKVTYKVNAVIFKNTHRGHLQSLQSPLFATPLISDEDQSYGSSQPHDQDRREHYLSDIICH